MRPPIIRIQNGTFFRRHPSSAASAPNPPLFPSLSFTLPSSPRTPQNWAIIGPSLAGKTTLLQILRGRLLGSPATARSFPYLSSTDVPARLRGAPARAIQYVGFDADPRGNLGQNVTTSAYLSARYESRREDTDFSLRDFLLGNTELNPVQTLHADSAIPPALFSRVVADLRLDALLDLPVSFLSNGQGRRARIARAVMARPEVLLLDEPFMGLDPPTVAALSPLLQSLAAQASPRLVLTSRPQDPLPDWITHLVLLESGCRVVAQGEKAAVLQKASSHASAAVSASTTTTTTSSTAAAAPPAKGEPLVEMAGCKVTYGTKTALGNWPSGLHWTIRRGDRWAVFGPNGSGKTTVVSLLCSDHPQTYSLPIRLFGRSRLPELGVPPLTFWDVQKRIGHSSPEVHMHMPRSLTLRQTIANAWAPTFRAPAVLDAAARARVDAALRAFEAELSPEPAAADGSTAWADRYVLGEVSFSAQRVALLLRAVIKQPDIVVLDEAFSGMDDAVRDKCMRLLRDGAGGDVGVGELGGLQPHQALLCISHVREEVPDSVREWVCLPEANSGRAARFGRLDGPLGSDEGRWKQIWDM